MPSYFFICLFIYLFFIFSRDGVSPRWPGHGLAADGHIGHGEGVGESIGTIAADAGNLVYINLMKKPNDNYRNSYKD